MRPNHSALSPAKLCKLPLGAFLIYALLLGLSMSDCAAQTRLNSSQVAPLKGDAQGSFATNRLRDINSAADHGNGTTNGVASAINDCGITITCSILVPPSYGTLEPVPGYRLTTATPAQTATTPGNIAIFDHRYGDARMLVNYAGYPSGQTLAPTGWLYNYYLPSLQNELLSSFYLRQWSVDGGHNQSSAALNYTDKTAWTTVQATDVSHTPGQHEGLLVGGQMTSIGNVIPIDNLVSCSGGLTTEGDQGCQAQSNIVAQGTVEYSGTLSGAPTTGATSLSVAPTQGANTQGASRFLVKTNAGTIAAGTVSQIATNYGDAVITGSGTAWPVSTVIASLGTNVATLGSAVVTPASFTAGAMTGIQTTSLVCVSDPESFEMLYPTAVTSTTFTANFAKIHPSNATIAVGGLCGYLMDLTADDVTNATYPTKSQTITGTLHFAWPMAGSTSATSGLMWVAGGGSFQTLTTRWNASTANGYVLYPYAEVISVQQNGGISNNLTVGPNAVNWTSGDTVSEFLYPAPHVGGGNNLFEAFYPALGGVNAFSLTYNVPLTGSDTMMSLINNGPRSFYQSQGGRYGSPAAIHIVGPTSQALTIDQAPDNAAIAVNCVSPCNGNPGIIAAGNASYYDFLIYEESGKHWDFTSNAGGGRYYLAGNGFYGPFSNTYLSADSRSNGFVATQQLRSNSASNTDINGELAFSNASSATQSLVGTYAIHPECQIRSQFDAGATNRTWVSYSGGAFTVNFASPVSGVVTYSCTARN